MENQLVSVVIAVYNVEQFLDACIKSICKQTYQNLQIILVDDGSTDQSGVLCDKWAAKEERVQVCHQKNSGVSIARNTGIKLALGEYIMFTDSDDRIEPDTVETLVKSHHAGNMTVAGYQIDCEGEKKSRSAVRVYGQADRETIRQEDIVTLFAAGLFSPIWNKLYECCIIREHGLSFCADMSLGEDILFNLSYIQCVNHEIDVINRPLYHYIKRDRESLDHKYKADFAEIQKRIYSSFLEFLEQHPVNQDSKNQLYGLYFNALIVAIDNLYQNRFGLERSQYRQRMTERLYEPEIKRILALMTGKSKIVSSIRYFLISHGLFWMDYRLRYIVKKILGLE